MSGSKSIIGTKSLQCPSMRSWQELSRAWCFKHKHCFSLHGMAKIARDISIIYLSTMTEEENAYLLNVSSNPHSLPALSRCCEKKSGFAGHSTTTQPVVWSIAGMRDSLRDDFWKKRSFSVSELHCKTSFLSPAQELISLMCPSMMTAWSIGQSESLKQRWGGRSESEISFQWSGWFFMPLSPESFSKPDNCILLSNVLKTYMRRSQYWRYCSEYHSVEMILWIWPQQLIMRLMKMLRFKKTCIERTWQSPSGE